MNEEEYTDPFIPDDTILPDDLRIALEVEKRILEYHHIAIDREKMFCHLAHLRIDEINRKIKALHEANEQEPIESQAMGDTNAEEL